MPRTLYVSKPLSHPLHDGSLCLVRSLAEGIVGFEPTVFTRPGPHPLGPDSRVGRLVIGGGRRFSPALADNLSTLCRVAIDRSDLWHFVFAPNARSCAAVSALRRARRTPTVQTIASPPRDFSAAPRLLFGDVVVAQSLWCKEQLARYAAGTPVEAIYPAQAPLAHPTASAKAAALASVGVPQGAPLVLYPGDLEFSHGAQELLQLVPELVRRFPDVVVVLACRRKTARAHEIERKLRAKSDPVHVRFVGEVPDLVALLAVTSVVAFPVDSLFGKVDLPFALLEAMALGVPVVTYDFGPLKELGGTCQVPTGNGQQLVDALGTVLVSRSRAEQVAGEQLAFVRSALSLQGQAAAYTRLYAELLASA